jgi:hypothetical protein
MRIINEYRNNRITVDFISKEGDEDDRLADACDGLYRADEEDSVADEAYDNAFEEAVGGGFGAWRCGTNTRTNTTTRTTASGSGSSRSTTPTVRCSLI